MIETNQRLEEIHYTLNNCTKERGNAIPNSLSCCYYVSPQCSEELPNACKERFYALYNSSEECSYVIPNSLSVCNYSVP